MTQKNEIVEQVKKIPLRIVEGLLGNFLYREVYYVAYVDEFDVDSDKLTVRHKTILDNWVAGGNIGGFPFKQGDLRMKIAMIAGMTSQTGSEEYNMELGKRRAQSVYKYLSSRIDRNQMLGEGEIESLGLTRPRINQPGAELSINRAVGIIMVVKFPIITTVDIPSQATPPPSPHSREWGISIIGAVSAGIDPIPFINVIGAQRIFGRLKNLRTEEIKYFSIALGGLDLNIGISTPIEISVNTSTLSQNKFTPFNTYWKTFKDFNGTWINLIASSYTEMGEDFGETYIGFIEMNTKVKPEGLTLKTNAWGIGAQMQYGSMKILEEPSDILRLEDLFL